MTYSTIMVHMDVGAPNGAVVAVAANLAERFKADVIGIAACQPMLMPYGEGYMNGDVIDQDRTETEHEINQAEARFRTALHGRVPNLHWRSAICYTPLADYIADNARSADLLVIASSHEASLLQSSHRVDIGELVIQLGRPLLLVPSGAGGFSLESVIIGWVDKRETRRAVVDALPLLQQAARVTVVGIAAVEDIAAATVRLQDVVTWLKSHRVTAGFVVVPSDGADAELLEVIANEHSANLLVAGAYGHNRLREWVFGGVTRHLLTRPGRLSLVSH